MLDNKQENPNFGTLYIVSTPIGHKRDITYRAADILQVCDIVIGEEFKEASRVLMNLNLNKPIELLNEHNEKEQVGDYIKLLKSGKTLALISDCGTPIFADPGLLLVQSAIQNNIPVVVVPGASSIMTAIVRSGFPIKKFFYAGFLSANSEKRYEEIKELMYFPYTFVVMDTPYRLKVLLEDFADLLPKRKAYLGMNLTLNSETHHYGTLEELYEKFKTNKTKAEYVLVVEGFSNRRDRIDGFKSDRPRRSEDFPHRGRRPFSQEEGGNTENTAPRRERSSEDRRNSGGFSGDRRRSGSFGDKRRNGGGGTSGDRKRSDRKAGFKSSRPKRSKDK